MDLHKVTFPTFVLEPRSMLERITDFMSHPDLLFGYAPSTNHLPQILCADLTLFCPSDRLCHLCALLGLSTSPPPPPPRRPVWPCSAELCDDPEERFIRVLQYYLAGWHIKPKGVKKPYVLAPRTCV